MSIGRTVGTLVLAIFAGSACHGASRAADLTPATIGKFVPYGVIFSAEATEAHLSALEAWTPTTNDIVELETRLSAFLRDSDTPGARSILTKLGTYKRQYYGYVHDARKLIHINAVCVDFSQRDESWKWHYITVFDGGECFFRVEYDAVTGRFEALHINGVA